MVPGLPVELSVTTGLQVVLNGLAVGCLYGLIAVGVVLLFKATKVVNVAHTQVGITGVFLAWWLQSEHSVPLPIAVVAGLASAGVLGLVLAAVLARPLHKASAETIIVATLGVLITLGALVSFAFGSQPHGFQSFVPGGVWRLNGLTIAQGNVLLVVVTAVLVMLLAWLSRTRHGLAVKAIAQDPDTVESLAVNVRLLQATVWIAAAILSGVAAFFVSARVGLDPFSITDLLVKALIAAVIGGLERVGITLAAALSLGLLESTVGFWIGPDYGLPLAFILVMVALAVLPLRWFGATAVERA